MQSKSQAWFTALTSPGAAWRYGLDILAADEATLLEDSTVYDLNASDRLVPSSGQITLDVTAASHRQFKLNLRNTDGRYAVGPAGYPSSGPKSITASGLVWTNVRYRPWIDLMVGFNANGTKIFDRTYLGIFVITNPQAQTKVVGSQMALTLIDKSALLMKPNLILNSALPTYTKNGHIVGGYASGSTFDSVMHDLASRAGIPTNRQLFEPSSITLPADYAIAEGSEWWTHLQILAGSIAHVLYFDGGGNLLRRANPLLANTPPVFTFNGGPLSIMTEVQRTTDFSNTYNHIVVIGGSSQTATFRGEATIQDQSNPYSSTNLGDRVVFVGKDGKLNDMTPDPAIGSTGQANTRAQVILAQHVGQQEKIVVKCRNIPALEPYDRVTVIEPSSGLALDMLVSQMTWNLAHDQMEVDGGRWFQVGG